MVEIAASGCSVCTALLFCLSFLFAAHSKSFSMKLITHLHKHTKPWIVSAPWRHVCWHMPFFFTSLAVAQCGLVCSDQRAHGPRHRLVLCQNAPYPPQLAEALAFLLTSAQDEGTVMHMDMVADFVSVPPWAHDSFAVDPQDLSDLQPREKQCHPQIRTSTISAKIITVLTRCSSIVFELI